MNQTGSAHWVCPLPSMSRRDTGRTNENHSVMQAQPHSCSAVHHHGEQDTMVYAAQGHGSIIFDGGKQQKDLEPGDFALIPAYDIGL